MKNQPVVPSSSGDALVAVAVRDGVCDLASAVLLRGSARRVFDAVRQGVPPLEVPSLLLHDGAASPEQARGDAERFVRQLRDQGLVGADQPAVVAEVMPCAVAEHGADVQVEGEPIESLARAALARGIRLRFRARGRSMLPFVADGSLLEVEPRAFSCVRRGEVVLYAPQRWRLVAHRAVAVRSDAIVARGDSCARADVILPQHFLGVVTRCSRSPGKWVPVSSGWRRVLGLAEARLHAAGIGVLRFLVMDPWRRSYASPSWLRRAARLAVRGASGVLLRCERAFLRLRQPLDVLRSALLSAEEKDALRRTLYARSSVQEFTSLEENVAAGLTLLEEVALARHPLEPGRALVLGCGPGRESFVLARRGFQVTGLDREPGMLERVRQRAAELGLAVDLVRGEAQDFRVPGPPFDLVVVFSGLYNMVMPRSRRVGMLRCALQHLRPGGRLLLTFLSRYVAQGTPRRRPGRTFLEVVNPDHEEGDVFERNEAIHVFPGAAELEAEAVEAGFEVVECHRDQRAYDRMEGRVRGYAILRRPPED